MALLAMLLWLSACAPLHLQQPRTPSFVIDDAERSSLARLMGMAPAEPRGRSGFRILASGQEAFVTRTELAEAAERSLDLQYFSAGDDLTSDLLLRRIVAAAERGVRVRILLDDIHMASRRFALRAIALNPGIQARLFNPFLMAGDTELGRLAELVFDSRRLNRRMHNKLWLTDNAVAIVGSRNIGDEYFGLHETANFTDLELLVVGPVVSAMSSSFDAYWNNITAIPLEQVVAAADRPDATAVRERLNARAANCAEAPPCSWMPGEGTIAAIRDGRLSLEWAVAQFEHDPPDMEKRQPATGIQHGSIDDDPEGSRTLHELLIVSLYFVPSDDGLRHLRQMRERGVRVAVLTNSLASTDSVAAHAAYARHRIGLLRAGVALYETRPLSGSPHGETHRWARATSSSLHAKFIVQDRRRVVVGSFNQDPRSRLHNAESWINVESVELADDIASLFEEGSSPEHSFMVELQGAEGSAQLRWSTEEDGSAVGYSVEPMTNPLQRLWRRTLGALIPEHLL